MKQIHLQRDIDRLNVIESNLAYTLDEYYELIASGFDYRKEAAQVKFLLECICNQLNKT